ncbi:MAG: hypothetical protein ACREDG_05640, partial [Methylocella sp.]
MTDSTGNSQSLADLLAIGFAEMEAFDWDTTALADWPNIDATATPIAAPASISMAEPQAADRHRA